TRHEALVSMPRLETKFVLDAHCQWIVGCPDALNHNLGVMSRSGGRSGKAGEEGSSTSTQESQGVEGYHGSGSDSDHAYVHGGTRREVRPLPRARKLRER